jgi:glycolate oxidase FAD binding subunit
MDNMQAQADWQLCRNQQLPFFLQRPGGSVLWRLSVAQTAPAFDLPWPQLVEWHGGLRWLWAPQQAGVQLQELAHAHGGHASIFIAENVDTVRANGDFLFMSAAELAITGRLRASFDPHGIFHPGPAARVP